MTIEIKELHIKINVDDNQNNRGSAKMEHKEKELIIAACVEQVMEILSKKEER